VSGAIRSLEPYRTFSMAFDSQTREISAFDDNLSRCKQAIEGINDIGTAQTASPFQRPDQLGQTLSARLGRASIVGSAKTAVACIFCWLDARRLRGKGSGLMSEGQACGNRRWAVRPLVYG
jgi:hypothetical protein